MPTHTANMTTQCYSNPAGEHLSIFLIFPPSLPPVVPGCVAVWYSNLLNALHVFNGCVWMEVSKPAVRSRIESREIKAMLGIVSRQVPWV